MKTKVKKWGNSLAVRLPKAVAIEFSLDDGAIVDIRIDGNEIKILTVDESSEKLKKLLKNYPKNTSKEIDWGAPVGAEHW